jgi:hypothetical protein
MRRHHEDEHGLTFDLDRDVYFSGNKPGGTTYDISSDPIRGERYSCAICGPGRIFPVGKPPHGTRQRNAFLQQTSPYLQGLLAGAPLEEHDAITEAYDRQQLGGQMPPSKPTTRKARKAAAYRKPDYQRRLDGFGRYFLDAYAREGTVERAIQSLVSLYKSDLDAYTKVLGESTEYKAETFRQYVYETTTTAEREQAKSRWRAEKDKRRAARRAPR